MWISHEGAGMVNCGFASHKGSEPRLQEQIWGAVCHPLETAWKVVRTVLGSRLIICLSVLRIRDPDASQPLQWGVPAHTQEEPAPRTPLEKQRDPSNPFFGMA